LGFGDRDWFTSHADWRSVRTDLTEIPTA
jgi:hypothetical protein